MSDTVGKAGELGYRWADGSEEAGARSVRTEHGGNEDNGGEENMSLHIENFVREKKLFDYLYGRNLCHTDIIKWGRRLTSRHTKSSSGSVVNMLSPKENRAMLIRVSFSGDRDQITTRGARKGWI